MRRAKKLLFLLKLISDYCFSSQKAKNPYVAKTPPKGRAKRKSTALPIPGLYGYGSDVDSIEISAALASTGLSAIPSTSKASAPSMVSLAHLSAKATNASAVDLGDGDFKALKLVKKKV